MDFTSSCIEASSHINSKSPTRKGGTYVLKRFQIHVCSAADKEFGQKINAVLNVFSGVDFGGTVHVTKGNGYQCKGNADASFVHDIAISTGSATGGFRLYGHIQ